MDDRRHHRVSREIIIVEVPAAGSPKTLREVKPGSYRRNQLEPWRPARAIPSRPRKAERLARFLDAIAEQDRVAREFMKPDAVPMRAWFAGQAV